MTCWHIDFVLVFSLDKYRLRATSLHNGLYDFCICSSIQVVSGLSHSFSMYIIIPQVVLIHIFGVLTSLFVRLLHGRENSTFIYCYKQTDVLRRGAKRP